MPDKPDLTELRELVVTWRDRAKFLAKQYPTTLDSTHMIKAVVFTICADNLQLAIDHIERGK